jgi:hypothetical protein
MPAALLEVLQEPDIVIELYLVIREVSAIGWRAGIECFSGFYTKWEQRLSSRDVSFLWVSDFHARRQRESSTGHI